MSKYLQAITNLKSKIYSGALQIWKYTAFIYFFSVIYIRKLHFDITDVLEILASSNEKHYSFLREII